MRRRKSIHAGRWTAETRARRHARLLRADERRRGVTLSQKRRERRRGPVIGIALNSAAAGGDVCVALGSFEVSPITASRAGFRALDGIYGRAVYLRRDGLVA